LTAFAVVFPAPVLRLDYAAGRSVLFAENFFFLLVLVLASSSKSRCKTENKDENEKKEDLTERILLNQCRHGSPP
jgi:hypothetical protein